MTGRRRLGWLVGVSSALALAIGCSLVIGDKDLRLEGDASTRDGDASDASSELGPADASADAGIDAPSPFGDAGIVVTDVGEDAGIRALALSGADIVAAGFATIAGVSRFAVARYRKDGTLDPTFAGGTVTTAIGSSSAASGVAVLPDGRVLAVGAADDPSDGDKSHLAMARYLVDGGLDTTFGASGTSLFTFVTSKTESLGAVALRSDGSFYVAGESAGQMIVDRHVASGGLDTTFDSGVRPFLIGGSKADLPNGIADEPSGPVVAGSVEQPAGELDMLLVRFDGSGGLIGLSRVDFGALAQSSGAVAFGLARIAPDGWVMGGTVGDGNTSDFGLARIRSDGGLDLGFGDAGKVRTSFGGKETGRAVAIDRAGAIVVAGESTGHMAIVRYSTTGDLDATFGAAGLVRIPIDDSSVANAMLVLPDGSLIVAGSAKAGNRSRFALAKH